jgi:hypothetical protein
MDISTAELHGRVQTLEFLLTQLLFEALQDPQRQVFVAKALQGCEDQLHRDIPALDADLQRVSRHALQSLKDIMAGLTLNLAKKPDQFS